jgi:RNA polymerase sigma factor (sigma-70 family)
MTTATMTRACQHIRRWMVTQSLGDLSDRQLLERFAGENDEAAFAALVRRHGGLVIGACRTVLQHQQDAEDAFQATFLVLARKAASVSWQESAASWLFQTARHMALKIRTHSARRRLHEVAMEDLSQVDGVADLAWGELRSILDEELGRLPAKYRAALVLCHMEGKSRSEAARELGWKEGAVKIRLERGRDLLRARLTRRGLALSTGVLGTMLGDRALNAAVPARLMDSTVKAATCFAAGKEAAAGLVSAQAVALAKGGLGAMAFSKSKLVALALAALLVTASTGVSPQRPAVAQSLAALDADPPKAAADPKAAAQDPYGDALPQGAKMRFGTVRLRHGGPVYFVGFSAKGKGLVSASQDGTIRVWELPSGKELRRIGKPVQAQAGAGNVVMAANLGVMVRPVGGAAAAVALSADGQTIALGGADGIVQLYDVATGKEGNKIQVNAGNARMVVGVGTMIFAPDGKSLATRGNDGVIHLWDIANGQEIRKFGTAANNGGGFVVIGQRLGGGGGTDLAFSPDGKKVAAHRSVFDPQKKFASTVQVWAVETAKELSTIKDDQANGFAGSASIALAPDSKTLALATADGTIRLFDSESAKEIRTLGDKGAAASALAFAPDGKSLAAQGSDRVVRLYDVENGKELRQLGDKEGDGNGAVPQFARLGLGGGAQALAYSPDGQTLAVASGSNAVRLWTVATGKEILPVASGHQGDVTTVAVSADGKTMTSCGADHVIRQWDTATGKELRQFKLPADAGVAVFSVNGALVAFNTNDDVRIWDVAKGSEVQKVKLPPKQAGIGGNAFGQFNTLRLAFSPDAKLLAVRGNESKVHLWEVATGTELRVLDEPAPKQENANPAAAAVLIRGMGQASAGVVFTSDGTSLASVTSAPAGWRQVGIQAGVQPVANNGAKTTVHYWNVLSGKPLRQLTLDKAVLAFALSPDDRNLATLNGDNTISIWEIASGKERCQFKGSGSVVTFAADGHTLAVASADRKVTVYDVRTGKELGQFDGHQGAILSLAFRPDGTTVFSGSADSTALSWDLTNLNKEGRPQAVALDPRQVEALWTELAGPDARKAYQAVVALSLDAKQAAPWLKEHIKPAAGVDPKRIEQLLADLDDNNFQVRQKAADELEKLGEQAEPALEKVLKGQPNLETRKRVEALFEKILNGKEPPAEVLQALRGVEVLEEIGGPEARPHLEKLAQGTAGAKLTRAAQASLLRLNQRPAGK